MNNESDANPIELKIDPEYIPKGQTMDNFVEFLRIDFAKQIRKNVLSYAKDNWEKSLKTAAKMFLLPKGFPVRLMEEPTGDIEELRNYLFNIGREIIERELKKEESEGEQDHKGRKKEVIGAAKDQRAQADQLNLTDEQLRDQSGETPEDVLRRMHIPLR